MKKVHAFCSLGFFVKCKLNSVWFFFFFFKGKWNAARSQGLHNSNWLMKGIKRDGFQAGQNPGFQMTSSVSCHPCSAVFSSVLALFLAGSFPCGIKMTAAPAFHPIFSIPFSPNQSQDGVSLALVGSLNSSWLQREDVGGRQSVLIGQAWVTHTLGAEGMSAPLDHRRKEVVAEGVFL